jgi:hypothetical protein
MNLIWHIEYLKKLTRIQILEFWWYRFQNSSMVADNDLKFGMVIVFGKMEVHIHDFLSGIVHIYLEGFNLDFFENLAKMK